MTSLLHKFSVPVCQRGLANLDALLVKAAAWAASRQIEPSAILLSRLAPDMYTFKKQILVTCDVAKNGCSRLVGVEAPKYEDNEASFDDLRARIAKTLAYLDTLKPEQFDEAATRAISFAAGGMQVQFKGEDYLPVWMMPNFYFHLTMAYALLRHNGLDIGKRDFLGVR